MNYQDFDRGQQAHINGVLAQFMDAYTRQQLVWTPEQMYSDFIVKLKSEHDKGWFGVRVFKDGVWSTPNKDGSLWMVSPDAKDFILGRFLKKIEKNAALARKKSPLIERARIGLKWDKSRYFDINYGLQNESDFVKAEFVQESSIIPWSIEHVENELTTKYSLNLLSLLQMLSISPIEVRFFEEWYHRFYSNKSNPAILPEFCGDRKAFYCYKVGERYTPKPEDDCDAVNVRFDFALVNVNKQKRLLIELDGQDFHAERGQRINDSVKRIVATNAGWQINVITGSQIMSDIDTVFESMKDFFEHG